MRFSGIYKFLKGLLQRLAVIPAKAGIQFEYASEGHKTDVECFAQRIKTGFRPSPE